MFICMTKVNKENCLGDIESYPPVEEADVEKLTQHFKDKINGPPDARILTIKTFALAVDPSNNKQYIFQKVDEADKKHSYKDTTKANQGRIYEVPGKIPF